MISDGAIYSFVGLYRCGKRVKKRKSSQWLYTTSLEVLQLLQKILETRLAKLTSLSGMDGYSTLVRFYHYPDYFRKM